MPSVFSLSLSEPRWSLGQGAGMAEADPAPGRLLNDPSSMW